MYTHARPGAAVVLVSKYAVDATGRDDGIGAQWWSAGPVRCWGYAEKRAEGGENFRQWDARRPAVCADTVAAPAVYAGVSYRSRAPGGRPLRRWSSLAVAILRRALHAAKLRRALPRHYPHRRTRRNAVLTQDAHTRSTTARLTTWTDIIIYWTSVLLLLLLLLTNTPYSLRTDLRRNGPGPTEERTSRDDDDDNDYDRNTNINDYYY